jgi:hypothetical protein
VKRSERVAIVGGGPSGLIASYVFRLLGADVTLFEPGALGGEFLAGGLKYLSATTEMVRMFERLDIPYSPFTVKGGIHLRGNVGAYPEVLYKLPKDQAQQIRTDHYTKTRRLAPDEGAKTAMNDPDTKGPRRALRCDFKDLIDGLADGLQIVPKGVKYIGLEGIQTGDGGLFGFDYAVVTLPLWITRSMVNWYIPESSAVKLNLAHVIPKVDPFVKWDYVYTPYTPANVVHRLSPFEDGYSVEANGTLDRVGLESDLQFLFPDGYGVRKVIEGLKGHLLPLETAPQWPDNVAPIGRFAKWDSRATSDVTLDDAFALAERWFK